MTGRNEVKQLYCRDCSCCQERSDSHGKCWAKDIIVAFDDDIANRCSWFRASSLRGEASSETKPKYGRLKFAKAG